MDLTSIPNELLVLRGQYATVRSSHEDEKKRMQALCGALSATCVQVLRAVQPEGDDPHDAMYVGSLLVSGHKALEEMKECAVRIRELAEQRAELKPKAWPRNGR